MVFERVGTAIGEFGWWYGFYLYVDGDSFRQQKNRWVLPTAEGLNLYNKCLTNFFAYVQIHLLQIYIQH